jgi:hypothetical protein
MSKDDFLSGKPFTALNTEGVFVFAPAMNPSASRIGLIKVANEKESIDCFCVVERVTNSHVRCGRYMLGQLIEFDVPLSNFTLAKAKKEKEVPNG